MTKFEELMDIISRKKNKDKKPIPAISNIPEDDNDDEDLEIRSFWK